MKRSFNIFLFSMIFSGILSVFLPVAECGIKKIAVVRTQPPHAAEIEAGLKNSLKAMGYVDGENIVYLQTIVVSGKTEAFSETERIIESLVELKPDLIATIGTQASAPAWPVIRKTAIPMIFSGVTYPVEAELIQAFNQPTGKNITGISYSVPERQRLEIIRKIFPDVQRFRKLVFIYSSQILQETIAMEKLKAMSSENIAGWQFSFIDYYDYKTGNLSYDLLIQRLKEADPDMAFGWYSLDLLSEDEELAQRLLKDFSRPILAITSRFTDLGGIGSVFTDHSELGRIQAEMIDQVLRGEKAGDIPPVEPDNYIIELNLKKAKELGIEFPEEIIRTANRIVN